METTHAEPATPAAAQRPSLAAWIALGLLIALAAALILHLGRGTTFFRDEWTFILHRDGHSLKSFFASHAGHFSFWPVVLYLSLLKTVGLDHYEVFRVVMMFGHLACGLLVFLIARRRVGDVVALAPAGILLFLGSGWMDILWPFQVGFTGGIAFGLAAIFFLDRGGRRGDELVCLCLLMSLPFSGSALPFIPGVAVGLLLRRRLRRRLWVVAVPAIAYLAWVSQAGGPGGDYAANLAHVPDYALHMAGAGITGVTGLPMAWGPDLALLATALVAFRLWRLRGSSPLAWEALAMAVTLFGLTAIARAQEHDPAAVRYVYPSAVFLLLLAVGLAPARVPGRLATAIVLVLAVLALPSNISGFEDGRDDLLFTSNVVSSELGALELARAAVDSGFIPEMNGWHGVPAGKYFEATERYGSSPADSPAEIAASPDYARRRADRVSTLALRIHLVAVPPRIRAGRCTRLHGHGWSRDLVLPRRGVVIERPRGPGLAVGMRRFADGFVGLIPVKTPPGEASFLRAPPDAEPRRPWHFEIGLSGSALVCAVSA